MANKLYAMELLTEEVAKDVAANPQEWMRFLNTASRLYRYTFPEQLLIYAQRPGATAVASMEIWNQKMYRWIKKGSKGIALIDNTSGPKTKLRYVFDVQDTYKVKNLGRDPQLWNLNPEGEQLVADYLQEQLALETTEGGLPEVLHQAAEESVQAWLPDAFDELQMDVSGTFLEDLDEQNQKVEFRELMTNSVWYVLLNRCGLDVQEYLDAEDFRHITDFNQLKVMGHLGSSVNEISRPVLMQIGRYVLDDLEKDLKTVAKEKKVAYNKFNTLIRESETKNTEDREKNKEETEHERDHLQPERRVSDSRYQPEETRGTIGKYGMMRKEYLRNYKVARFNILTLQNRLDSHLMEIDSQARQRVDNLMNELLEKDPAPDKMADTMAWTRHMNQIKAQAEELVIQEIIYS